MHLTKDAVTFLNQALHLPATGREQDWDLELADQGRAEEFVAYLEGGSFSQEQKFALMSLILASVEDMAREGDVSPVLWGRVQRQLRADSILYAALVRQWGPKDDDPDSFAISPRLAAL